MNHLKALERAVQPFLESQAAHKLQELRDIGRRIFDSFSDLTVREIEFLRYFVTKNGGLFNGLAAQWKKTIVNHADEDYQPLRQLKSNPFALIPLKTLL